MDQAWLRDRIIGCILGGAIGDAMGGPYEGTRKPIEFNEFSTIWRLSDDTQLTLATCEAITVADDPSPEKIAANLAKWYKSSRVSGMGASTLKALIELAAGGHWALVGRKGDMAAGNGAAMRAAPLAFVLDPGNEDDRVVLRDICRITHHSEEAYVGALAVVMAIHLLVFERMSPGIPWLSEVAKALPDANVRDRLLSLSVSQTDETIENVGAMYGTSGYVAESVPLALYGSAVLSSTNGFTSILEALIRCGGDTDTIASIAGQIMGAYIGSQNLPAPLVRKIPQFAMVSNIASAYADRVARSR